MSAPSCVAVIPARGGSKGLPRKNVRELLGKPLIAYAIEAARAARSVTRVVVSTDDAEIAQVARRFGADVFDRPAELATDTASSESVLIHALGTLGEEEALPDLVMMIQCTSPLTTTDDLDATVARLVEADAQSCFTAAPFHHFLWTEGPDGARGVHHDGRTRRRRQDLEAPLLENGAVYVMRTQAFLEEGTRFCGRTVICVTDPARTLEIDDAADFARAEAALRFAQTRSVIAALPTPPSALVFDFDGVFTDNAVYVREDGVESVRCDRGDGLGLGLLRDAGVPLLVLSKERNPVVAARMAKLGLEHLQGVDDKLPRLMAWLESRGLDPAQAIYVGNDVNDLACMRAIGSSVCPSDAHEAAKAAARLVLQRPGGHGAVRELCDLVLAGLEG